MLLLLLLLLFRKHFREVLKEQMSHQDYQKQQDLKNKIRESEAAVEYDRMCLQEDTEKLLSRYTYLKNFRDGNKRVSYSADTRT